MYCAKCDSPKSIDRFNLRMLSVWFNAYVEVVDEKEVRLFVNKICIPNIEEWVGESGIKKFQNYRIPYDMFDVETNNHLFRKTINKILYGLAKERYPDFDIKKKYPEDSLESKIKSYIYDKSELISDVMLGRTCHMFHDKYGISLDEIEWMRKTFKKIFLRVGIGNYAKYRLILYKIKQRWSENNFTYFIGDMMKLNQGLCNYILTRLDKIETFAGYTTLVKDAPTFIKNCKYILQFDKYDIDYIECFNMQPKTRFQYYFIKTMLGCLLFSQYGINAIEFNLLHELRKFFKNDDGMSAWYYFKKYRGYKGPYSIEKLDHMLLTILDGADIYRSNIDNPYGIDLVNVKGSPVKQIQRAIYNHNQEKKIRKRKLLESQNHPMSNPPFPLPRWVEDIRLKSQHDLLIAGEECGHCIGNYTSSEDVFVREGNVCAQISRSYMGVVQCYDEDNRITDASKDLKRRLKKSLKHLGETANDAGNGRGNYPSIAEWIPAKLGG